MGGILRLWLSVVCCGRDVNLNLFNDKLVRKVFLPHPSSPARRGSTSPSAPSPQERAPTGKPAVLYSQTSFNCVDSRLHSAEHSNEFDALLSLAREFAHKGLLVVIDAIALRLFDARCASVCAPRARMRKFLIIDC